MTKREVLSVEARSVFGKQLKKLRREGILPGNVYGKDFKSTAVQVSYSDFNNVYKKTGSTNVVDLELDGKKHPVLIHNLAMNTLTNEPIHADFFIVNLKEKITAQVPVVAEGEPQAVAEKKGVLLQLLNEVEIEALPTDLPESLVVDVISLAEVDDQINIEDVKVPTGITILNESTQGVFKIGELVTQEAVEQEAQEEAEAAAESEAGEAEESKESDNTESSEEKQE